jgi:hypothetical protein
MGENLLPEGLNGCINPGKRLPTIFVYALDIRAIAYVSNLSIAQIEIPFLYEFSLSQ